MDLVIKNAQTRRMDNLVDIAIDKGKIVKIVESSDTSPELEADRGRAYGQLAFVHRETGDLEQALEDAQQAQVIFARLVEREPDEPSHWANVAVTCDQRGSLLTALGMNTKAEEAFREALFIRGQLMMVKQWLIYLSGALMVSSLMIPNYY